MPDLSYRPASSTRPSETFIAIGIDFGTTFSGVSWTFSEYHDRISQISEWPTASHLNKNEIQVPTLYDLDSGRWGYQITTDQNPVKWFKLLLLRDEDCKREEIRNSPQLIDARRQLAQQKPPISPVQVVGYFLQKLWNHTYEFLQKRLDIDNLPIRVAITVPAIWPPYAQSAMREAARLAGITANRDIGVTELDLVQEPEAASLSTMLDRSRLPEIQEGDTFVVCDAGGGTVDVISYRVISERPFKLEECVQGDGKLSGAVLIDDAFTAYLNSKSKLKLKALSEAEYNSFFLEGWERGAKRSFGDSEEPSHFNIQLPSKAYKKLDRIRAKDHLAISRAEMRSFFARSVTGIRSLISEQWKGVKKATGNPPKKILLVGGLGDSLYIHNVLKDLYEEGTVLRPLEAWSAVARGAVIRLLHNKMYEISIERPLTETQEEILHSLPNISSRKSRYSYGILVECATKTLSDLDPDLDKVRTDEEGIKRTPRMHWYLKKGEDVGKMSPVQFSYTKTHFEPTPKCIFNIKYSSSDTPPIRDDSTVIHLCEIECDWDKPFSEWKRVGKPSRGARKHEDLGLTMTFEGEPKWTARVGLNKKQHAVNVTYI